MNEIKLNTATTLNIPASANRLTIQHDWGDLVVTNVTVTPNGTYNFTPNSIGIHSFIFSNGDTIITYPTNQDGGNILFNPTISGNIISTTMLESVAKYSDSNSFFTDYDFLDVGNNSDNFVRLERKVRRIINTFTRQNFGGYINKTKMLEGDGGNSLTLPLKLNKLTSCIDNFGNDITQFIEIAPDLNEWVQRKPRSLPFALRPLGMLYDIDVKHDITMDIREFFPTSLNFILNGNWGWNSVPNNVTEAANILLMDEYTGEILNHPRTNRSLGAFSEGFYPKGFDSTTGNLQADLLLADYININLSLA